MAEISYNRFETLGVGSEAADRLIKGEASHLYEKATRSAKYHSILGHIFKLPHHLKNLCEVLFSAGIESSHYAGTQVVEIGKIKGSESRSAEFDDHFNPLQHKTRERWLSIARAFLRGEELPPVELIQVGDEYFVRDGHHRVSVARTLGQYYIDAEITEMQIRKLVN